MTTQDRTILIRLARPDDDGALRRLAALDSTRPLAGAALIALADGEPRAALSLADGRVVADPFSPTQDLVDLLRIRARPATPDRARRLGRLRHAVAAGR